MLCGPSDGSSEHASEKGVFQGKNRDVGLFSGDEPAILPRPQEWEREHPGLGGEDCALQGGPSQHLAVPSSSSGARGQALFRENQESNLRWGFFVRV